jgi:hypothetical protein
MKDIINNPPHYNLSEAHCECGKRIECIDITRNMGFNVGNAIKYLWRFQHKNGLEDLKKARWYLNDLINQMSLSEESIERSQYLLEIKSMKQKFERFCNESYAQGNESDSIDYSKDLINNLNIRTKTKKALISEGIYKIEDLLTLCEHKLITAYGIGRIGILEIKNALKSKELKIGALPYVERENKCIECRNEDDRKYLINKFNLNF